MTDAEINRKFDVVADHLAGLTIKLDKLADAQTRTNAHVEKLIIKVEAIAEAQAQTAKDLSTLAKAQARTDAKLDTFMDTMERFIQDSREQRNGKK